MLLLEAGKTFGLSPAISSASISCLYYKVYERINSNNPKLINFAQHLCMENNNNIIMQICICHALFQPRKVVTCKESATKFESEKGFYDFLQYLTNATNLK